MSKFLFLIVAIFLQNIAIAQTTTSQQMAATRTSLPIKIDGEITDEAWKTASKATNFIEQRPTFGSPENEKTKTEFYLLYDDNAIYIGGFCHEQSRDSIATELVGRDNIGVNDFIGVVFDAYQDKINGLGFFVTPLGEQFDIKYSLGNEDGDWSTVYKTGTKITSAGWTFEMMIPYSALRFSKAQVQNWGMNIIRRRAKSGKQYSWNPINPQQFGFMNQAGTLTNIQDIKSPIRLSFSPYIASYVNKNPGEKNWNTSINGGMDVKYGLSKGFTLDMTLIPDFGQVQSDNQVLNLTPFEIKFSENRPFFTEGTELFNKGNFFYSRRIGGRPLHHSAPYNIPNATVIKNPGETKLLNATKISGRTSKGLGIGFFNAIAKAQHAIIEDDTKTQFEFQTSPLTNYNILVLDQTMKHNSSVTLVNTNVMRNGSEYDANVSAAMWDFYDKKVDWNFWGKFAHSRIIGLEAPGKTNSGNHYTLNFGKFKGRFNFEVHQFLADKNYNQRDLGFFTNNNYIDHGFWAGYKWVKPKGIYNNIYLNLNGTYSQLLSPRRYQRMHLGGNINGQLKNLWGYGLTFDVRPEQQDFYEPRIWGKMVELPSSWMKGIWFSTNRAKKYSAGLDLYHRKFGKYDADAVELRVSNNYRFSDKLSAGISNILEFGNGNLGFALIEGDHIFFGLRDRNTAENIFNVKYSFSNKMGLTFRARHYWSKVHYKQFFILQDDGKVTSNGAPSENPDINLNLFNIDMNYAWEFAPGSFINVAYKSAGEKFDKFVNDQYYNNLKNTLKDELQNNFSVKVIYFLDYLSLKKKRKTS